jgi:hypothetical protein
MIQCLKILFKGVLGRRENKKRENKTRKPMHVFGLMSYQARPKES